MKSPRDVIIRPIVSEKSYGGLEQNTYTFLVSPQANKTEIKEAIQQIWNVRVLAVNTMNRKGKVKRKLLGKAYEYRPVLGRDKALREAASDMLDRMFGGSVEALLMSLVKSSQLDADKLAKVQKLIESQEQADKEE